MTRREVIEGYDNNNMFVMKFMNTDLGIKVIKMNRNIFINWRFCLVLSIFTANLCEGKRFCRDFKRSSNRIGIEEPVPDTSSNECPLSASAFRIYNVMSSNESDITSKLKLIVNSCYLKIFVRMPPA